MSFSESQLQTWSNQGATVSSAATYASIKACIDQINWNSDITYEIYLQGSYRNSTNIYGNSDIDVVIEFTSVFYSNQVEFTPQQRADFDDTYLDGKYSLSSFKQAIVAGLSNYYGIADVKEGNKAITIKGTNGRLDADVVCCASYRKYRMFSKINTQAFVAGIIFWELQTGKEVINYPKNHYDNGVSKNVACRTMYKPLTRIFKNMKVRMVSNGTIANSTAPSYFVECLLYNMPSSAFDKSTYQQAVNAIITELGSVTELTLGNFVCQNEQINLFGSTDRQWNVLDCLRFIVGLIRFNNAGQTS